MNKLMKRKAILTLIVFSLATISFSSCEKLLESPKSFVTPDKSYSSSSQIEAAFTASMSMLYSAWSAYGYGMANFNNDGQLNGGTLIITENWASDLWAAHYQAIANLNTAIGSIEQGKVKGADSAEIHLLLGQARFLRGFNYFMLVRMFGGLPLVTENTENPTTAKLTRSSIADVYNQIIGDFSYAIANLPSSWPASEKGRPTADAARGLLAKAYLTMATNPLNETSNYQKAADLAKQVMDNGNYQLVHDINSVFSVATKYGPEMMWSFNANENVLMTDPHIWSDMDGWGDFSADPIWTGNYPDQPRKYAYIQIYSKEGQSYLATGHLPGIQKYLYDTQADFDAGRSVVNIPIIRYADVLLIYAEASNMANGGPTQAAVDAINQVINRANGYVVNANDPLATINISRDSFDTKVIQERNFEMCFEYDRWFDVIRKRILKEVSDPAVQQNFNERDYLFPIPLQDIEQNPKLTQNPGY